MTGPLPHTRRRATFASMTAKDQLAKAASELSRGKATPEKLANALTWIVMIRDEEMGHLRPRIEALLAAFDTYDGPDGRLLASARRMTPSQLEAFALEIRNLAGR